MAALYSLCCVKYHGGIAGVSVVAEAIRGIAQGAEDGGHGHGVS